MKLRPALPLSSLRDRSRSARERSKSLRATSQQLRESLENLRAYAAQVNNDLPADGSLSPPAERAAHPYPAARTPLDFATVLRQRMRKACSQAQALRRHAALLRNQAAENRARSEGLRSNSASI